MRRNPTLAEKLLWIELRHFREEGLAFRRQAPIGPYIVDFVCHSARLIIELDGGVHVLTAERDAVREAWLMAQGYRVLRFDNGAIIQEPSAVQLTIKYNLQNKS